MIKLFLPFLIGLLLTSCGQAQPSETPQVQRGYLYKVEAAVPGKEVYICGQRPFDVNGELVGAANLSLQTRQVFENLKASLETVNMNLLNVTQVTYFVKGTSTKVDTASVQTITAQSMNYFSRLPGIVDMKSVSQNVRDDVLIEIEVIAVK